MKNTLKAAIAVSGFFIAGSALALPASAAGWMAWEGQNEATPRVIYTDASDQAGAMLACNAKGEMVAMLTLEPASIPDVMKRNAQYARGSEGLQLRRQGREAQDRDPARGHNRNNPSGT
ncbi:hypothetical protein [Hyphomonas sp.]|uniref:hypothetical protein n=1 Tax=Hyphomonas sp. TaxID=87 RepID=UPI001BCB11B9|nr:hypothetical protein [Hyphomonas sp.]